MDRQQLQDSLLMEREENIRLREEIKAAERDKGTLSKKLLEHE